MAKRPKYIRPALLSALGKAHKSRTGHKVRSFIGIYPDAKTPTKMKITECKNCSWWDHEF